MRKFLRSFRYAARGLALCLRERNFRGALFLPVVMYAMMALARLTFAREYWAVVTFFSALVLAAAAFQLSVKATGELADSDRHPLAVRAKDITLRKIARGLALCLRERNFRIHLVISVYMYVFLAVPGWFVLTRGQWAVLIATNALVLAAEAFNTAIEAAVDLACPEIHPLAARAKDAAAGAVLLCCVAAVAVGAVLLWQPEAFVAMWQFVREHLWVAVPFGLSLAGAVWFVFGAWKKVN
jgi:diacylglycerol kinase (ATP)